MNKAFPNEFRMEYSLMLLNFTKELKIVVQKLFNKKATKEFELYHIHKNKIKSIDLNQFFIEDEENEKLLNDEMKKEF